MSDISPTLTATATSNPSASHVTGGMQPAHRSAFDRLGISVSLLCAVHCMAAPFLLLALPAAGAVWSHPLVHWGLALFVLPLAMWVIINGFKRHRQRWTLVAALLGASLIVAGLILPMVNSEPMVTAGLPWLGEGQASVVGTPHVESVGQASACSDACCPTVTHDPATGSASLVLPPGGLVTLVGSLFLVFAHLTNLVGCRRLGRGASSGGSASDCGCPAC
jgi:hypothetical protein